MSKNVDSKQLNNLSFPQNHVYQAQQQSTQAKKK